MPNKLWKIPSSTVPCTVNTLERNFALQMRSLAKWGRSRSANQVVLVEGSLFTSSSSLATTTTTTTTTTSSSSSTKSLTTEEESRVATDQNDTSLLAQNEIRQVPSQESTSACRPPSSTSNIMEEESSGSGSGSSIESSTDLDSATATTRKRPSSLDQQLDRQGPGRDLVQKQARSTREESCHTRDRFMSILDRPFQYWHELNMVLKEIHPEWSPYQRGRMIHHLIHFLELKIGKDDYVPTGLLIPTAVVEAAWRALVMETSLYLKILHALQDFYDKERAMIHYSVLLHRNLSSKEMQDQIRRTQSLFLLYFKEIMPLSIDDEPRHLPSLIPIYDRQDKSATTTPTFGTVVPSPDSFQDSTSTSTIVEVGSDTLSLKDLLASLPGQDDTASTQEENSLFSGEESEGLMGLELVD